VDSMLEDCFNDRKRDLRVWGSSETAVEKFLFGSNFYDP